MLRDTNVLSLSWPLALSQHPAKSGFSSWLHALTGEPDVSSPCSVFGLIEAAAGIGMWQYSFATRRHYWSPGVFAVLGLDPNEGGIKPDYDLFVRTIHPDDRLPTDNFDLYMREVRVLDRRFRVPRPDGTMRWVSQHAEVLFDANQDPAYAVGIMSDITARVAAEGARDCSEARLRTFQRAAHCFTWVIRADGHKQPSPGWANLTGQTSEESEGAGWLDAVYPADRARVRAAFTRSWATQTPYAAKYRLMCRDGGLRWFLARSAPVFDEAGRLREWFGVSMDLSDLNTANEALSPDFGAEDPVGGLIRAARALLDWSIEDLASCSGVSISSIRRIESEQQASVRNKTAERLMHTLKDAGIEFYEADDLGTFIRLRDPRA